MIGFIPVHSGQLEGRGHLMSGLRQWTFPVTSVMNTNSKFSQGCPSSTGTEWPYFVNPHVRRRGVSLNNFGFMVMSLGTAPVLCPEFSFINLPLVNIAWELGVCAFFPSHYSTHYRDFPRWIWLIAHMVAELESTHAGNVLGHAGHFLDPSEGMSAAVLTAFGSCLPWGWRKTLGGA